MNSKLGALVVVVGSASVLRSSVPGPAASPAPPVPLAGAWTTGSTGALGDVVYGPGTHVIDLATEGVYDPVNWRIVFDYQTLSVEAGATITFANHPTRAPVVMRALGDVVIDGTIVLDGAPGHSVNSPPSSAEPGPGGFRGGRGRYAGSSSSSAGFGPGGGFLPSSYGFGGIASYRSLGYTPDPTSYGAPGPTYGNASAVPLVGGSGASSGFNPNYGAQASGGGAGGGALLIGSDTHLRIAGSILARGGSFGPYNSGDAAGTVGSGGAIRLVAPVIEQTAGMLDARGAIWGSVHGGEGAIRIEVDGDDGITLGGGVAPDPSLSTTLGEFLPQGLPTVVLKSVWDPAAMSGAGDWVEIDTDPSAAIFPPTVADVQLEQSGPTVFRIEGRNVPLGATLHVRTTHTRGQATIDSAHTMGEVAGSTLATSWTDVSIDLSEGVSAIQVRAELP